MDPVTNDTDESAPCVVHSGENAYIVGTGILLPNGEVVSYENCKFEVGSNIVASWGDSPVEMTPAPRHHRKAKQESSVDHVIPETPVEPAAPTAPAAPAEPSHHETAPMVPVSTGEETSLGQAIGAAAFLKDNPFAPLVMIALAAIAVLGGRQGWKFYSERSAQNHELEMKKLELQAQSAQAPTQQPPPCIAKQAETDARIGTLDARIDTVEARIKALEAEAESNPFADFDPEDFKDLDKRLKKLEKSSKPAAKPSTSGSSN